MCMTAYQSGVKRSCREGRRADILLGERLMVLLWNSSVAGLFKVGRHRRRRRRIRDAEGVEGWEPTRESGGVVSSPSGVRAEPRPKTNLVHSGAVRKPLVAITLSIPLNPLCMFFTKLATI